MGFNYYMDNFFRQYRDLQFTNTSYHTYLTISSIFFIQFLLRLYHKKLKHDLPPKFKILNLFLKSQQMIAIFFTILRRPEQDVKSFASACLFYYAIVSNIFIHQIAKLSRLQSLNSDQEIVSQQYAHEVKTNSQENQFIVIIYILIVVMIISYYYCDPTDRYGCYVLRNGGFIIALLIFIILFLINLIQLNRTFDHMYSFIPLAHIVIRIIEGVSVSLFDWAFIFQLQPIIYGSIYCLLMLKVFSQQKQISKNRTGQFQLMQNSGPVTTQL